MFLALSAALLLLAPRPSVGRIWESSGFTGKFPEERRDLQQICTQASGDAHKVPLPPSANECDESSEWRASGIEDVDLRDLYKENIDEDPVDAQQNFQADSGTFPLGPIGICQPCDIGGFPPSPGRPALFVHDMFVFDGVVKPNFNDHDLPITDTYFDKDGRPFDVYETVHTWTGGANLFAEGQCMPEDYLNYTKQDPEGNNYTGTGGLFFYEAHGAKIPPFSPGPTVKNCKGRQGVMRFVNDADSAKNISVHLHGGASIAPYDGWADDVTVRGYTKTYFYPNNRAASLWYHDHAVHITADNAYSGLAAQYIVKECDTDLEMNYLPAEDYSIPFILKDLVLQSKGIYLYDLLYQRSGDAAHLNEIYGDIIAVNGVPWPKLEVKRRTYRLRMLNVSISRPFLIKFLGVSESGQQAWLPFYLAQTDGGNVKDIHKLYSIFQSVAERATILLNFDPQSDVWPPLNDSTGDKWKYVFAVNDFGRGGGGHTPPQFCKTHLLARFDISDDPTRGINDNPKGVDVELNQNSPAPEVLQQSGRPEKAMRNLITEDEINHALQRIEDGEEDREFRFERGNGEWQINGCTWADDTCRIISDPGLNGLELWKLKTGGGWFHPVHIHLIDFLVLKREGGNSDLWEDYNPFCPEGKSDSRFNSIDDSGECQVRKWEVDAAKDVVHLGNSQTVWVIARWGPHTGDFMFHCHNLVHEDNDMMVANGVGRKYNAVELNKFLDEEHEIFYGHEYHHHHHHHHEYNGEHSDSRDGAVLRTEDSTQEFYREEYFNADGRVDSVGTWTLADDKNDMRSGTDGAPFSPQASGIPLPEWRNAMSIRAEVPSSQQFDEATGRINYEWLCERVCGGYYEVLYPNGNDDGTATEKDQFNLRSDGSNITKNIWAEEYPQMQSATEVNFTRTAVNHTDQPCNCTDYYYGF